MIFTETAEYKIDGAKQELPGFDEKYVNIVDYILKITDEIWEQRAVWVIYETYTKDVLIHAGAGEINGIEAVVSGTVNTLSGFPDRKMGGEAVIWSDEGNGRFFSSHRIGSTATNLGETVYGAATGKKVFFRTIADCAVHENKIYEEWLVRDNLHLVQQLGFDPVEMAKRDQRYATGKTKTPRNTIAQSPNGTANILEESTVAKLVYSLINETWGKRDFEKLTNYYHTLANVHAICDSNLVGVHQLKNYAQHLMNSFPDARIIIDRVTCNERADDTEVACRWKIVGTHSGDGFFSPASGEEIILPVISHYIIKDGKISEEWMIFDGFDLLCQIHANAKPAASTDLENKKMIVRFLKEMNKAIAEKAETTTVLKKYLDKNVTLNITEPYKEMKGLKSYANDFWLPLLKSFPDLEDQPYILIGGQYEGREYVSCTGNLIGTFKEAWHDIPPTNQPTWLRYSATFLIENNKIKKTWYFFDIIDVMRQAGFNFFPNRGTEHVPPAPMTGDGIVLHQTDEKEGKKSIDLTNAMLTALGEYDGKTLQSMDQTRFWDVQNMMWYGPSGIGTTRGLKGFENNHQVPFITAFPDRGITEKVGKDYFTQIGDGNYSCDFGFPAMYGTHLNDGWLGLKATGKTITLRVVDYWRREDNRLKENWVFIDVINILKQLGVDVFDLMKKEIAKQKK